MKKIFTYTSLLLMLLPVLGKSALYIWFEMNQNYVAEKYCVNKEREDCKGCCFLNEQIKKVDSNQDSTPVNSQKSSHSKSDSNWDYLLNLTSQVSAIPCKYLPFQNYLSRQHSAQYLAKINKPPCWINSFI